MKKICLVFILFLFNFVNSEYSLNQNPKNDWHSKDGHASIHDSYSQVNYQKSSDDLQQIIPPIYTSQISESGYKDQSSSQNLLVNDKNDKPIAISNLTMTCPKWINLLPHPTDCDKYIFCDGSKAIVYQCPFGKFFDLTTGKCDFKHKIQCVNNKDSQKDAHLNSYSDISQQINSELIASASFQDSSKLERSTHGGQIHFKEIEIKCPVGFTGLKPHPNDCSKFLNCANGQTHIQPCSPGTLFNELIQACDYPYKVKCENSMVSSRSISSQSPSNSFIQHIPNKKNTSNQERMFSKQNSVNQFQNTETTNFQYDRFIPDTQLNQEKYNPLFIPNNRSPLETNNRTKLYPVQYNNSSARGFYVTRENTSTSRAPIYPNLNNFFPQPVQPLNPPLLPINPPLIDPYFDPSQRNRVPEPPSRNPMFPNYFNPTDNRNNFPNPNLDYFGNRYNNLYLDRNDPLRNIDPYRNDPFLNRNNDPYLNKNIDMYPNRNGNIYPNRNEEFYGNRNDNLTPTRNNNPVPDRSNDPSRNNENRNNDPYLNRNNDPSRNNDPHLNRNNDPYLNRNNDPYLNRNDPNLNRNNDPFLNRNDPNLNRNNDPFLNRNDPNLNRNNDPFLNRNDPNLNRNNDPFLNRNNNLNPNIDPYLNRNDPNSNNKPIQNNDLYLNRNDPNRNNKPIPNDPFLNRNNNLYPNNDPSIRNDRNSSRRDIPNYPNNSGNTNSYQPGNRFASSDNVVKSNASFVNKERGSQPTPPPFKSSIQTGNLVDDYYEMSKFRNSHSNDIDAGAIHLGSMYNKNSTKFNKRESSSISDVNDYLSSTIPSESLIFEGVLCDLMTDFECEPNVCISKDLVCNGVKNCENGNDERYCVSTKNLEKELPTIKLVNEINVKDCIGKLYLCENKKFCISTDLVCNGKNDCEDNSDEKFCFDDRDASNEKNDGNETNNEFVKNETNETNIVETTERLKENVTKTYEVENIYNLLEMIQKTNFSEIGEVENLNYEKNNFTDGVKTKSMKCPKDYWMCGDHKECIKNDFVCDLINDCTDGSDESLDFCNKIELRLVGGKSENEGRVEVLHLNEWGTICDDDFDDLTAKVVCKQLGYFGEAKALKGGHFGSGEGQIWLDQLICLGNESSISDCHHNNWGLNNCGHNEDAAVICSQPSEKNTIPENLIEDLTNKYPWQASIRVPSMTKEASSHLCGAVIISEWYLLTAAHCLHGFTKKSFIVRVGDFDQQVIEDEELELPIDEYYVHEKFRKGHENNNDIAIVKLKNKLNFKYGKIESINFPDANKEYQLDKNNCVATGWGSSKLTKSSSRYLHSNWISIQPTSECKKSNMVLIGDTMICAGDLNNKNLVTACDGDSGGPLACLDENNDYMLYGLTSWNKECGSLGVFVKIVNYIDWIRAKLEETFEK